MLDGGTNGSLELNDGLTLVDDLVVDDDLEVEGILVHDALDRLEVAPCVLSVRPLH